ncbi:GyrI-like domain-containing protein [Nonomuraea sp. NPDC050786]|uniref:GyrI-like domain-containing protein n=1 Tax=Nonomuraea sp. NPDC050786 TaxID=3154840 RepID=UPI0033FD0E4C
MNSPHSQDVIFHTLAAQPVARVRHTVAVVQLQHSLADGLTALWRYLLEHDVQPDGPPYVRYHSFDELETDIEIGVPTQTPALHDRQISTGHLPAGPAIGTWHPGAHDRLADAYGRLQTWTDASTYEPHGGAWEIYTWIDLTQQPDPSNWPAPSTWHTQLIQPLVTRQERLPTPA